MKKLLFNSLESRKFISNRMFIEVINMIDFIINYGFDIDIIDIKIKKVK